MAPNLESSCIILLSRHTTPATQPMRLGLRSANNHLNVSLHPIQSVVSRKNTCVNMLDFQVRRLKLQGSRFLPTGLLSLDRSVEAQTRRPLHSIHLSRAKNVVTGNPVRAENVLSPLADRTVPSDWGSHRSLTEHALQPKVVDSKPIRSVHPEWW